MYDPAEYINGLHLPIEIGDIFQKTDGASTKSFILVGQPCDLMVRSDGKRGISDLHDVMLAEVKSVSKEEADKEQKEKEERREEHIQLLPYFGTEPSGKHYVMFRRIHVVAPCVLDLCVFNSDGKAVMDVSAACPDLLVPAWAKRFEVLQKRARAIVARYSKFADGKSQDKGLLEALRQEAIKSFPPSISNSGLFKASIELSANGGRMTFNCKRVARLCRPRAIAMALPYAACLCRPAFDRDLG
jgi:hypothetical protein